LAALTEAAPEAAELYRALARPTLALARARGGSDAKALGEIAALVGAPAAKAKPKPSRRKR
jgi:hypothetical protein